MNSGNSKHVCFYSNKCKYSKAFFEALASTPFKSQLQFVCVDGREGEFSNKYGLQRTPTLIIRGEDELRTFEGCMNWLSEQKILHQGGTPQGGSTQQMSQEPEAWISGEMGGSYTKSFSFINGEQSEAPNGNFEYLNGQSAVGTSTASDIPGGNGKPRTELRTKKADMFDKQMVTYMQQREQGMMPPVARS